jgi:hypothetical protein
VCVCVLPFDDLALGAPPTHQWRASRCLTDRPTDWPGWHEPNPRHGPTNHHPRQGGGRRYLPRRRPAGLASRGTVNFYWSTWGTVAIPIHMACVRTAPPPPPPFHLLLRLLPAELLVVGCRCGCRCYEYDRHESSDRGTLRNAPRPRAVSVSASPLQEVCLIQLTPGRATILQSKSTSNAKVCRGRDCNLRGDKYPHENK